MRRVLSRARELGLVVGHRVYEKGTMAESVDGGVLRQIVSRILFASPLRSVSSGLLDAHHADALKVLKR